MATSRIQKDNVAYLSLDGFSLNSLNIIADTILPGRPYIIRFPNLMGLAFKFIFDGVDYVSIFQFNYGNHGAIETYVKIGNKWTHKAAQLTEAEMPT